MDASKVRVHPQTLANSLLSKEDKVRLRREKVLDYIRSKPIGTPMSNRELGEVAGYKANQYNPQWVFLNRMIADGILKRERLVGTRKQRWTIMIDGNVVSPARNGWQQEPDHPQTSNLEELAKTFAWEENSNDLREFVKWAKVRAMDEITEGSAHA